MLAVLAIVALSAVLWLLALIRMDPRRGVQATTLRVVRFFLLGMLSVVPATVLYRLYPYEAMYVGLHLADDFLYNLCGVGPIEELSKFVVFFALVNLFRSIREPEDGIYQAAAVGLGFAIVENVKYGLEYGLGIAAARSFVTPVAHMIYASLWGFMYASRVRANPRVSARDRASVLLMVLPAALVHGVGNFLSNFGPAILGFDFLCALTAALVLVRLREESTSTARDPGRTREALGEIGASRRDDPTSPRLHLRAAHFRLRAGDTDRAVRHLDRYLSSRPGDPYGLGLKGAARVLAGAREEGERLLERADAMMRPDTRRAFHRNLRLVIAPGRGRRAGGFDESMLRTWLVLTDLNRERRDPRRVPPRLV
jgi:RsiW-degrading membrane proteinase PrsW (M82 family)